MTSRPEEIVVKEWSSGSGVAISSRVQDLTISTMVPGGDAECRWVEDHAGDLTSEEMLQAGTKITVEDDQGIFWVGRVEVCGAEYWVDGQRLDYTARGYASSASDQIYVHRAVWYQGTGLTEIYRQSCEELCPSILPGSISVALRKLGQHTEDYVLQTAQHVWNSISHLGDGSAPLVWQVVSGGSEIPILNVAPKPQTGAYFYRTKMQRLTDITGAHRGGTRPLIVTDLQQVRNHAVVKFAAQTGVGGYKVFQKSAGSVLVGNIVRSHGVDLQSLAVSNAQMIVDAADEILAQMAAPESTGRTITLHYPQEVYDTAVNAVPLWRVRAGHIIKVDDLLTGNPNMTNEAYILGTSWSESSRTLTLQVGAVRNNPMAESVGNLLRRKIQGGADPTVSALVPQVSRNISIQTSYDMVPDAMSFSKDSQYASGSHTHGTPNGDIAVTFAMPGAPSDPPIAQGTISWFGLIRGTFYTWQLRVAPAGANVALHVTLPASGPTSPGGEFTASGGNGAAGLLPGDGIKIWTLDQAEVEVTGIDDDLPPYSLALILSGTRNQKKVDEDEELDPDNP